MVKWNRDVKRGDSVTHAVYFQQEIAQYHQSMYGQHLKAVINSQGRRMDIPDRLLLRSLNRSDGWGQKWHEFQTLRLGCTQICAENSLLWPIWLEHHCGLCLHQHRSRPSPSSVQNRSERSSWFRTDLWQTPCSDLPKGSFAMTDSANHKCILIIEAILALFRCRNRCPDSGTVDTVFLSEHCSNFCFFSAQNCPKID
jgi:hypothetical protein